MPDTLPLYQFISRTDTSFVLKSGEEEIFYKIPDRMWTWTTGQMLRIFAKSARELSDMASNIFNWIISSMRATPGDADVAKTIQQFFLGLWSGEGKSVGTELLLGIADVLDYVEREHLIGRVIAVSFLRNGEPCIDDEDELNRRIALFERCVPTQLVGVALRNFFMSTKPSSSATT